MKLNKKSIGLAIFILITLAGVIFLYWKSKKKPEAEIPPEKPEYIIIKDTPEGQIVENTKKGVAIKVPEGWEANEFVSQEDIEIRKFGLEQKIETELTDGIVLDLYVKENNQDLNIKEWILTNTARSEEELISEKVDSIEIIKTENKIESGLDEYGNPTFVENGKNIVISFTKSKKIYRFSCIAVGTKYQEYIQKCEEIIKDKIKNEL